MLEFTNKREISSADQLTPLQAEQLRACGNAYDGSDLSPAELLPGADGDEGILNAVEVWDVVEDDTLVYEAWLYQVDSGTIFRAGTTELVAEIIQCGLECDDETLKVELGTAMARGKVDYLMPSEQERYLRLAEEEL